MVVMFELMMEEGIMKSTHAKYHEDCYWRSSNTQVFIQQFERL
jgi:hypothetical protein